MMVLHNKVTIENEIPLYATMRTKKEKGSNILEKVLAITNHSLEAQNRVFICFFNLNQFFFTYNFLVLLMFLFV
jgi:hypothetical protein